MPTIPYKKRDGTKIPGTTTVISQNLGWNKQQLMWWANQEGLAGRNHRDTSQKAADSGTVGHYLIDCHIKGITPDLSQYPEDIVSKGETAFLNYLEWAKMVNMRVHCTEVNLVSEIYGYGATPDCVGYVTDKLALVDYKTGSGVYPDMKIQLAAYRNVWEEVYPDLPLEGGFHLLRVDKESAAFAHYHWHSLPEAWEAFKHLLELERLRKVLK